MNESFQNKTDIELVKSFNTLVGTQRSEKVSATYLKELKYEFDRRNWDYNVITNPSGAFNLSEGNYISLIGNRLFLEHHYIQGTVKGLVVIGEIIQRTRLWVTLRILAPYIGWENCIGLPNQALGADRHFWTIKGNNYAEEYGLRLLIESYEKVKVIDENIDVFAEIYDELQKELKAIDKTVESATKEEIIRELYRSYYNNLKINYGLHLSIYDYEQFEKIILSYKLDKRKIYLNK